MVQGTVICGGFVPSSLWLWVNAGTPLARSTHSGALGIDSLPGRWLSLLINPDLCLFFKLKERVSGIWRDPPKGVEAVRQYVIKPSPAGKRVLSRSGLRGGILAASVLACDFI